MDMEVNVLEVMGYVLISMATLFVVVYLTLLFAFTVYNIYLDFRGK